MEVILTNYSFIFLTIAVFLRLFHASIKLSLISYACALGIALGQNYIEPIGFVFILIVITVMVINNQNNLDKLIKLALWLFIVIVGFGLISHNLPGFNNIQLIFEKLSDSSGYYNLWMNYDSIFFGVALFIFNYKNASFSLFNKSIIIGILSSCIIVPVLMSVALYYNLIAYEYFIPEYLYYWIWVMGLYALVEEAFFRMFIIGTVIGNKPYNIRNKVLIIFFSSLLFAYKHNWGGYEFMKVSFVAGLFYSMIYIYSGKRVESSFIVHFIVNIIHMIFFTYPFLILS